MNFSNIFVEMNPCKIKHNRPHKPKYWNSLGNMGDNILNGTANRGMESVNKILVSYG
jgi:hypothetical protein